MRVWVVAVALLAAGCSQVGSDSCPDVYFVGVRGSGQEPGMGPQVDDVHDQFLAAVGGEVESVALDYPAAESRFGDSSAYEESVRAGALALPGLFASLECPDADVVLAGFSQGAHVIAVAELPSVDAVILLASPVFAPSDATAKSGDFNPDQGGLIAQVPIDEDLTEKTIQVCLRGDPVCQSGSIAFWVHSGSYFGDALTPAADFAASRVAD